MKKEDLLKEVARLEQSNREWSDGDLVRRKGITKMLRAPRITVTGSYGHERTEETTYTWPEIYYQLGILWAKRDYVEVHEKLKSISFQIGDLEAQVRNSKDDKKL